MGLDEEIDGGVEERAKVIRQIARHLKPSRHQVRLKRLRRQSVSGINY